MYRDVAKKALDKLERFNYKTTPDFGLDKQTEDIIENISNECKSTVMQEGKNGYYMKKYESLFHKDAVYAIVRELIRNGNYIPKEVMNECIFSGNGFVGIDSDVRIYKTIDSETTKRSACFEKSYIELEGVDRASANEDINELYKKFAREIVFEDSRKSREERFLPKQNNFRMLIERLTNKKFSKDDFCREYASILRKYSNCKNENAIQASSKYKTEYIYQDSFKLCILKDIKEGNAIDIMDKSKDDLKNLIDQIATEISEREIEIPNINKVFEDIKQIYSDVEAQLMAYSINLEGLSPKEIEDSIKSVNYLSLSDERKKYLGNDGYRCVNVGFNTTNDKMRLLEKEYVGEAMEILSNEIFELVNNSDCLTNDEYLKRVCELSYRFICIHPFPDSNGRTSRAFINMMSLNRNILISFPKETKNEYTSIMNSIARGNESKYLKSLYTDAKFAKQLEQNEIEPLYQYVRKNSTLCSKKSDENIESVKNIDVIKEI